MPQEKPKDRDGLPDLTVEEMGGNLGRAQAAVGRLMLIALPLLALILGGVYLLLR